MRNKDKIIFALICSLFTPPLTSCADIMEKSTLPAGISMQRSVIHQIEDIEATLSLTDAPFSSLDINGDNALTAEEFIGHDIEIFQEIDKKFDGRLTKKEYANYKTEQLKLLKQKSYIPEGAIVYEDIPYTENPHQRQYLDLYKPANSDPSIALPLVIWVHGGSWRKGSRIYLGQQAKLLDKGFAVASINYRLSYQAPYPAQIHDCKAALRYLRKHAQGFGIDADKIGLWGASAGGHLVALMGTTGDNPDYEGDVGVKNVSTKVQAVNVWYGPVDMFKMYDMLKSKKNVDVRPYKFPIPKLFDGMPDKKSDLIRHGSPAFQVDKDTPPFSIMHAAGDRIVPLEQSEILKAALDGHNVENELHVIDINEHSFFRGKNEQDKVHDFFERTLKN